VKDKKDHDKTKLQLEEKIQRLNSLEMDLRVNIEENRDLRLKVNEQERRLLE